jgi:hypothetical protein
MNKEGIQISDFDASDSKQLRQRHSIPLTATYSEGWIVTRNKINNEWVTLEKPFYKHIYFF